MSKKKYTRRQLLLLCISMGVVFVVTIGSVGTLAWMIGNRQNNGDGNIVVDKGLAASVYSFNGNYSPDENGQYILDANGNYQKVAEGEAGQYALVGYIYENYTELDAYTDLINTGTGNAMFREVSLDTDTNNNNWIMDVGELNPGVRFSFAIVVTSQLSYSATIGLKVTEYTASYNPEMEVFPFRQSDLTPIYMTEAIDMMSYSASYNSGTVSQATSDAKDFILNRGSNVSDKFNETSETNSSPIDLTSIECNSGDSFIFFFTLEFSDDSSTFYIPNGRDVTDLSRALYTKSTDGNSNVYQNGVFTINKLAINIIS